MNLKEIADFRRATKAFDPKKIISDEDLAEILYFMNMAPTSVGYEQWAGVVLGPNQRLIRKEIEEVSWGQKMVSDASHLIIITNYEDKVFRKGGTLAYDRAKRKILLGGHEVSEKSLERIYSMLETVTAKKLRPTDSWSSRQAYIALGFAMVGAAYLKIDSVPMEGFEPSKVEEILKKHNLLKEFTHPVLLLPIGYRKDDNSFFKRERIPVSEKFVIKK